MGGLLPEDEVKEVTTLIDSLIRAIKEQTLEGYSNRVKAIVTGTLDESRSRFWHHLYGKYAYTLDADYIEHRFSGNVLQPVALVEGIMGLGPPTAFQQINLPIIAKKLNIPYIVKNFVGGKYDARKITMPEFKASKELSFEEDKVFFDVNLKHNITKWINDAI